MSLHTIGFTFYFLTFVLVLQVALGDDPIGQVCSNSDKFTAYSPYETNLNTLMGYLYFGTPMTGFSLGAIGQSPNQVYGLALCRANVTAADCKSCVVNASAEIHKSCPYGKQAKIWYDKCFLKYSSDNFFGQIDNQDEIFLWNLQNVSNPLTFNNNTKELLTSLAKEASETSRFYAAGEVEMGDGETIYGFVQCTKDLSCSDCLKCVDGLIGELPSCCDGKQGARIAGGSCYIRYETYPFLSG